MLSIALASLYDKINSAFDKSISIPVKYLS